MHSRTSRRVIEMEACCHVVSACSITITSGVGVGDRRVGAVSVGRDGGQAVVKRRGGNTAA